MILMNILWPTFALVLLVFAVWATTLVSRVRHMKRVPPAPGAFASRAATAEYFAPVEHAGNNLANLFEMPVLFFALVPLLLFTRSADLVEVALAWLFVVARYVHSYLHVAARRIPMRFLAYAIGCAILSAMWIGFLVDMVAAALSYSHAMNAVGMQP